MSNDKHSNLSRRSFVRGVGTLAGSAALGSMPAPAEAAESTGELPRRVLGRTGLSLTSFTLGTAPAGIAKTIEPPQIAKIVNEAIDLGVNSIDTSPKYGNAQEGVGLGLGRRRKDIVLATKVWADTIPDAEKKLADTFKTLKTDYADILYFHHLGIREVDRAMDADGVFTWLLKQKKAGKCRFLGISAHNLPGRCIPFLETGEVDVLLCLLNYADRHTYNFEEKVLPLARKKNAGIVAMKLVGGPNPKTGSWGNPKTLPMVGVDKVELALRYVLSIPGVTTANLGVHNVEQLRQDIEFVKRFKPLSAREQEEVEKLGKQLAADWGTHFGPVDEKA